MKRYVTKETSQKEFILEITKSLGFSEITLPSDL